MVDAPFDIEKANQWFAVELNNLTWELFEADSRTPADDQRMLHAAHAACYHWSRVGTSLNQQRALGLLVYVHAALGMSRSAQAYATQCLELSDTHGDEQTVFDRATALACAGRAAACAGKEDEAAKFKKQAEQAALGLDHEGEKEVFAQLNA